MNTHRRKAAHPMIFSLHRTAHVLVLIVLAVFLAPMVCRGEKASEPARWEDAPVDPQQIEADWLRPEALRQNAAPVPGPKTAKVAPEDDAQGACDGIKNGQYGFHTDMEEKPWWQVDLGRPTALDRSLLYNRRGCEKNNAGIMVLVSDDAKSFRLVYRHNGVFGEPPHYKPLTVDLKGTTARYVRLQLPGRSYLYLDEVEVYAA